MQQFKRLVHDCRWLWQTTVSGKPHFVLEFKVHRDPEWNKLDHGHTSQTALKRPTGARKSKSCIHGDLLKVSNLSYWFSLSCIYIHIKNGPIHTFVQKIPVKWHSRYSGHLSVEKRTTIKSPSYFGTINNWTSNFWLGSVVQLLHSFEVRNIYSVRTL